jgi:hypothetical protein
MVKVTVRKYNVCKDELDITGKAGLYCFFPFERLDETHKGCFKVGYTSIDLTTRVENYHTYFPTGVYIVFFLEFDSSQGKAKQREMELKLFKRLKEAGGKMLDLPSRPSGKSEWFYCSFAQLRTAFLAIQAEYGGELKEYNLNALNGLFARKIRNKNKFVGEIIFKV